MLKTAFKFILYDRAKSIGALMGIVISLFLIGQQSGIFMYLTNAMRGLVDHTKTDLWVVDNRTQNVNALAQMDIRKAREVAAIPGVSQVYPMIVSGVAARFSDGSSSAAQLIGCQLPSFKGGPSRFEKGSVNDLIEDGAVTFDYYDRRALNNSELGTVFEIGGKRTYLAAMTKGIRGFGALYMYTSIERARFLANIPDNRISAILVDLEPGANPEAVKAAINQQIFGVRAWIPEEFGSATVKKILSTSGIAASFGTLIVFAIISGFFIIGLTLYSSAIDRIKDYGTLKAIGASDGYVARLILTQALIFSFIGYAIGYGLIEAFRAGIGSTGAIFSFSWTMRLILFGITLLISLGGASFAIRRINGVEPASVFRG